MTITALFAGKAQFLFQQSCFKSTVKICWCFLLTHQKHCLFLLPSDPNTPPGSHPCIISVMVTSFSLFSQSQSWPAVSLSKCCYNGLFHSLMLWACPSFLCFCWPAFPFSNKQNIRCAYTQRLHRQLSGKWLPFAALNPIHTSHQVPFLFSLIILPWDYSVITTAAKLCSSLLNSSSKLSLAAEIMQEQPGCPCAVPVLYPSDPSHRCLLLHPVSNPSLASRQVLHA